MLIDPTSQAAEFALDALAHRRRLSADNVANAMTPGFRAHKLDFEASLSAAIASGEPAAARTTVRESSAAGRADGNNVQLEDELAGTSGLHFEAVVQVLNYRHSLMRSAIR